VCFLAGYMLIICKIKVTGTCNLGVENLRKVDLDMIIITHLRN
jgi:hypothetical protein